MNTKCTLPTRIRVAIIALVLTLTALAFGNSSGNKGNPSPAFLGCWRVTRVVPTTNISALSDEDAKSFLGREVTYSKEKVTVGNETRNHPNYQVERLSSQQFFNSFYNIPLKQVGISEPAVTVFRVKAEQPFFGGTVLVKDSRHLIVEWQGAFFELQRMGSSHRAH